MRLTLKVTQRYRNNLYSTDHFHLIVYSNNDFKNRQTYSDPHKMIRVQRITCLIRATVT